MEALPIEPRTPLGLSGRRVVGLALSLALASAAFGQDTRPDKVFHRNPRTGKVSTSAGRIVENSLEQVRIEMDGDEDDFASAEVVRIEWGAVPPAFSDATTYHRRGDYENAVAMYRVAAGDASAREVVQAAARLRGARSLLAWGAQDPNRYAECVTEVETFLASYPNNRDVPTARWVKGRALWLSGDAASAAASFKSLFDQGSEDPPTTGYDREQCLNAGLSAAWAFLDANDSGPALQLFVDLKGKFEAMAAAVEDPTSPDRARLLGAAGEAAAGEGFHKLANQQTRQAINFFDGILSNQGATPAEIFTARIGLAEAYESDGKDRLAQIEFAKVSSLEYLSRDRRARALLGYARVTARLGENGDQDTGPQVRMLLTEITERYGDTPSARVAAEKLAKF